VGRQRLTPHSVRPHRPARFDRAPRSNNPDWKPVIGEVRAGQHKDGTAAAALEIRGCSREYLDASSPRRQQIEAYLATSDHQGRERPRLRPTRRGRGSWTCRMGDAATPSGPGRALRASAHARHRRRRTAARAPGRARPVSLRVDGRHLRSRSQSGARCRRRRAGDPAGRVAAVARRGARRGRQAGGRSPGGKGRIHRRATGAQHARPVVHHARDDGSWPMSTCAARSKRSTGRAGCMRSGPARKPSAQRCPSWRPSTPASSLC
jgi:hypothetical protein